MRRRIQRWALSTTLALAIPAVWGPAFAQPRKVVSEPAARQELHVTAYRQGPQDTAFLREVREVDLPAGEIRLALQGVPDTVQRETVTIRVIEGPPVQVLEQTFDYDLMDPDSLMHAAEGTDITIDEASLHDGKLRPIRARVMASGHDGTVLRTDQGYTFGLDGERRRFSRVPERLTPRPTLMWHAKSQTAGKRTIEISYLLTGLKWTADYVATVSRNGTQLDLSGWVTFKNDTAGQFANTNLAVAAGTLHRILPRGVIMLQEVSISGPRWQNNEAVRETLGHLHLYKIPQRTDLEPHSIKNVQLLTLRRVPADRRWITGFYLHPSRDDMTQTERPRLVLEMRNDEKSNAGIPIPAGTVRVMVPDRKGTPHMVASTSVSDTPKGEPLKIDMGPVANVKARLVPKDYRTSLLGSKEGTYSLEVRNGSTHTGVARVDLQGAAYTTIEVQGAQVQRPSSNLWRLEVRLGPGATKTYRVVAKVEPPRR